MKAPLYECLKRFAAQNPARFFMPGHKGGFSLPDCMLSPVMPYDVTELPDTGNLYEPVEPMEEARALAARAFRAKAAYFSTGGSSHALFAALLLTARSGRKVLIDRMCHRSIGDACAFLDLDPSYLPRQYLEEYGVLGPLSPADVEQGIVKNRPAAVVITSPSYHGVVCDIERIAAVCHKYGVLLLVDGAHGAHFGFHPELPRGAQSLGADFCVVSAHKTLPALTQGAFLFDNTGLPAVEVLAALAMTGTSSPSFLVSASLDYARAYLEEYGERDLTRLLKHTAALRALCAPSPLRPLNGPGFDPARLTLSAIASNTAGSALYDALYRQGVMAEMADEFSLVLLPSLLSSDEEFSRLTTALSALLPSLGPARARPDLSLPPLPPQILTPAQAMKRQSEEIPMDQSLGRVCQKPLYHYPPGVPVLLPGEQVDEGMFSYIKSHFQGNISVIK